MEDKYFMDLSRIRLERAEELIHEAKVLLEKEMYKAANNRAYYAIEKAMSALLISHKIEAKTHNGVLKMFNLEFVRNGDGTFGQEDYAVASAAEHIRNISDYDDFYIANKKESEEQVKNAEMIMKKIRENICMG